MRGAACRFGPTPETDYASLPSAFSATGGLSHSSTLTGLTDGTLVCRLRSLPGPRRKCQSERLRHFVLGCSSGPDASECLHHQPSTWSDGVGVVTVVATASDNVGVAGVQFLLEGVPLGAEDGTTPYSVDWTTSSVANGGPYALTARARDAAGHQTVSTAVNVTVNNTIFPGLVAAYGFEDGTGTVLADNSGRGHPGTIAGATWTTAGRFGQALTFDGINDWVTIADATDLDLTSGMTLEAWVYPTALGNGSWRNVLIKERQNGEVTPCTPMRIRMRPRRRSCGLLSSVALDVRGSSQLPLNTWSHLTVTFDNTTLRIFIERGAGRYTGGGRAVVDVQRESADRRQQTFWRSTSPGRIDNVRTTTAR